ncbi:MULTISPECIES: hypothetical protein [unclassified Nocardia]|uniref:hypothetical protein n=1 Tax=unclassified Nocardia TaxID=2637762 RepID=UPI001CE424C7|nr:MULTISPECIES: hypothetical protein [unclassified Nocardia]
MSFIAFGTGAPFAFSMWEAYFIEPGEVIARQLLSRAGSVCGRSRKCRGFRTDRPRPRWRAPAEVRPGRSRRSVVVIDGGAPRNAPAELLARVWGAGNAADPMAQVGAAAGAHMNADLVGADTDAALRRGTALV